MSLSKMLTNTTNWIGEKYSLGVLDWVLERMRRDGDMYPLDDVDGAYREKVYECHGMVHVPGCSEPVQLADIFVPVALLEPPLLPQGHVDVFHPRPHSGRLRYAERVNGLTFVKHMSDEPLFILGKPGAGKTTFLKYLAVRATRGDIERLPVFVSLTDWADSGLELLDFIARQFAVCDFAEAHAYVRRVLADGKALVLFDGLDEVKRAEGARRRMIARLALFNEQYPGNHCVIATRDIIPDASLEKFRYVTVADFDLDQMRMFVEQWFRHDPAKGARCWATLIKEENRALRTMARVPLLLTLLCLNFDATSNSPQQLLDLYAQTVDVSLQRELEAEPEDKTCRVLDSECACQLLARVAAVTFQEGHTSFAQETVEKHMSTYMLDMPKVEDRVSGATMLRALEASRGFLIETAPQLYTFVHPTFHTYFAAQHIVTRGQDGALARLIQHLTHERWHELFVWTAHALRDTTSFFTLFRQAIDDMVRNDITLETFLHWADRKAAAAVTTNATAHLKASALRSLYCYLDLSLALARAPVLERDAGRARARDLALDLARALDHNLALDLALDLGLTFAFALDRDRDHTLRRDRDLARALMGAKAAARAAAIGEAQNPTLEVGEYLSRALNLSQVMGLEGLQGALVALINPEAKTTPSAWLAFADELERIIITYHDTGYDWAFTEAQAMRLANYFAANVLFVECLEAARVDTRDIWNTDLLKIRKSIHRP